MKTTFKLLPLSALLILTACGVDGSADVGQGADDFVENSDALSVPGHFETFTGADGQFYFHLIAGNGEKVLASQGYATAGGALSGIDTVRSNGANTSRYLIREASDGSWYFVLTATNGRIIGMSEMYVSQSNATRAVTTVAGIVAKATAPMTAPSGARFEIFKGLDSKYYFHLRAANGEIVLQSQAYTSHDGADKGIASVQTNGIIASRYSVLAAADGEYYWVLKAGNGWVIGRGELYATQSNAQRGVDAVIAELGGVVSR